MSTLPDDLNLLRTYVPSLSLHPEERFPTTTFETLTDASIAGSRTELRRADGTVIATTDEADGTPMLSRELLWRARDVYPGTEETVKPDDYLRGDLDGEVTSADGPTAYGRVVTADDSGFAWLQYWLFYYENPHWIVGDHQGDWELVQFKVSLDHEERSEGLLAATFFQHGHPEGRNRTELAPLLIDDGLPIVYVARGSHASYFDEEHLSLGDEIGPLGSGQRSEVVLLDNADRWLSWPGYWGGTRVMGHPRSPRGPRICRREWEDPEDRHAAGLTAREPRRRAESRVSNGMEAPTVTLLVQRPDQAETEDLMVHLSAMDLERADVEPVCVGSAESASSEHLLVTIARPDSEVSPAAAAFEAARHLNETSGWEVEPDLDSTIFRPTPDAYGICEDIGEETKYTRWAVEHIGCSPAWDHSKGDGVRVGHPDTGTAPHLELEGVFGSGGWDVLENDSDPSDQLAGIPPAHFPGHGVGTASVIASREGRNTDLVGSAPGAEVIPFRVACTVVLFGGSRLLRAIQLARRANCEVISISLGGLVFGSGLRKELDAAVAEGRIVLAAAGQPVRFVVEPASYESTLAVAGSTIEAKPWKWTARGSAVDFAAPAARVPRASAIKGGTEGGDGTSFSTALAAGAAAVWVAANRERLSALDPGAIQPTFLSLVQQSVREPKDKDWDAARFGAGIIDAGSLMSLDLSDARPKQRGVRASRGRRILDWLSRLVEVDIEPWIERNFGEERERAAERFGTELAYIASEDEAARLELRAAAAQAAQQPILTDAAIEEMSMVGGAYGRATVLRTEVEAEARISPSRVLDLGSSSLRAALADARTG